MIINKQNWKSLRLGRTYARIFVLGHYLFLKARRFSQPTFSKNCSLPEIDNIKTSHKYTRVYTCQMEAIFLRLFLMLPSPYRIQTYEIEVHYTLRSAFSKLRLPQKWAISSASGNFIHNFYFYFYFLVMTFVCILCSTVFHISGLRIYWITVKKRTSNNH